MEMNPGEGLKKMTQEEAEKWREIAVKNVELMKRAVEAAEHTQAMYEALEKRHEKLRSAIQIEIEESIHTKIVCWGDIQELLREDSK